jgi:hypothetical protein
MYVLELPPLPKGRKELQIAVNQARVAARRQRWLVRLYVVLGVLSVLILVWRLPALMDVHGGGQAANVAELEQTTSAAPAPAAASLHQLADRQAAHEQQPAYPAPASAAPAQPSEQPIPTAPPLLPLPSVLYLPALPHQIPLAPDPYPAPTQPVGLAQPTPAPVPPGGRLYLPALPHQAPPPPEPYPYPGS